MTSRRNLLKLFTGALVATAYELQLLVEAPALPAVINVRTEFTYECDPDLLRDLLDEFPRSAADHFDAVMLGVAEEPNTDENTLPAD